MATLTALHEAMTRLDEVWAECDDVRALSRPQLLAVNGAVDALKRRLDAVHVDVAARIAEESRSELGADSLAKQQGYRSSAKLIAASTGMSTGDASRLIKVGEATAPRADLLGAPLPAKYPLVRDALGAGALSVQAAALIVALLDRCRIVAGRDRTAEAERALTDAARGLGLDDVRRLVTTASAGGVETEGRPTSTTGCCSARPVIIGSTTTGGRSVSTGGASTGGCGSSPRGGSTPNRRLDSAGGHGSTVVGYSPV